MQARLYDNGYCVRVDLGNTGKDWPKCNNQQWGFPYLTFGGKGAWEKAEEYARENGAKEILIEKKDM